MDIRLFDWITYECKTSRQTLPYMLLAFASLNVDWFAGLAWKKLFSVLSVAKTTGMEKWAEKHEEAAQKDKELQQGEPLERHDVVRMVQVQLRLSCGCRGSSAATAHSLVPACGEAATVALGDVTQGIGDLEFEHALKDRLAEAKHKVQQLGMRGVLMLVRFSSSHTPDDLQLCWSLSEISVCFILSYPEGSNGSGSVSGTVDAKMPK